MNSSSEGHIVAWFGRILALVRRDYAVQFAGTSLGLVWLVIQYAFQIAIFYVIFGYVLSGGAGPRSSVLGGVPTDYLSYLLGGMCLWLPISDMLLRSGSILSENRSLLRRTSSGQNSFLWVPVFQAVIHYGIIFALISLGGLVRGTLSMSFPLAFLYGTLVIIFFAGWGFILARVGALVKDVSPILRLLLQAAFWATPIVYAATPHTARFFAWNPFHAMVEIHRRLLFNIITPGIADQFPYHIGAMILFGLSVPLYFIASRRLSTVIADHI